MRLCWCIAVRAEVEPVRPSHISGESWLPRCDLVHIRQGLDRVEVYDLPKSTFLHRSTLRYKRFRLSGLPKPTHPSEARLGRP